MPEPISGAAEVLRQLYDAGVKAAAPGPMLRAALANLPVPAGGVWVIALGKAAHPMAEAALDLLGEKGQEPAGGLVVGPDYRGPLPPLTVLTGNHPVPGKDSLGAATTLGVFAQQAEPGDEVWVLLSGGTSSLIAAPIDGISPEDLFALYRTLLTCGLDITMMNTVRKRFSRWAAGRLGLALLPAKVRVFIVSDVIGDDIASIGSGPCSPDPATAAEVGMLLSRARLPYKVPDSIIDYLGAVGRDEAPETPKVLEGVETQVVVSNGLMLKAVEEHARSLGLTAIVAPEPLSGEAAGAGAMVARAVLAQPVGSCMIWGGETTVKIEGPSCVGGRCQELALAASRVLNGRAGVAILAAGSDGRDGPTDAAGAAVDGTTWETIIEAGRDPGADLANHDSHHALEAAGALLRTGPTGTNVMDLVIGLSLPESSEPRARMS